MRRLSTALFIGAIGSAAFASPALAQQACGYGPCDPGNGQGNPGDNGNGNGSGQGNDGDPGNNGNNPGNGTANGRPGGAEQSKQGTASNDKPKPGESVQVSGPANTFKPGTPVSVGIVRGKGRAQRDGGKNLGQGTAATDGGYGQSATIPADAEQGVYFIYMSGTDASGKPIVVIIPVTVPNSAPSSPATLTGNSSSAGGTTTGKAATADTGSAPAARPGSTLASAPSEQVPVSVAALRLDAPVEEALVDAVTDDDAVLRIDNDQLIAASQDGDDTRPLVAALAIGVAGGGVVLLRRRASLNLAAAR